MSLPGGYTKLTYIQSSGTQYINTGYNPNNTTRVVMDAQITSSIVSTSYPVYFGCNTDIYFRCMKGSSAITLNWEYGSTYSQGWDMSNNGFNKRRVIDANGKDCTVDGVTKSYSAQTFSLPIPLFLLAANVNSEVKYLTNARLYSCKIYDNGALVRDFIPCKNASSVVGLWDDVNGKFYANAGSGTFAAGPATECVELEYIESTGTQSINTGLLPTNTLKTVVQITPNSSAISEHAIFGASWSISGYFLCFYQSNIRWHSKGDDVDVSNFNVNSINTIEASPTQVVVNGTSYPATGTGTDESYNILLFATANQLGRNGVFKLHACQMYDNGLLVRDFVPARNIEGQIGLYDKVYDAFYTNEGTGVFTAGPEVDSKEYVKLEYIESSGTQYVDTGFKPNQNTGVLIDVDFLAQSSYPTALLGGRNADSSRTGSFSMWLITATQFQTDFGSEAIKADIVPAGRFLIFKNKAVTTINDQQFTNTATTFQTEYSLGLFTQIDPGGPDNRFTACKLYSCQIYDNGVLIRDYIPMCHSSGVVGLWDAVNEHFYSSGSATNFIAGPEASVVPKAPANFNVVSAVETEITLSWDESEKAVGYRLYRNNAILADTNEREFAVSVDPFISTDFSVSAYNENGESGKAFTSYFCAPNNPLYYLVTDREQADVTRVKELAEKIRTQKATQEDINEWNSRSLKGSYNATDLNRVGYAMQFIANEFQRFGYNVSVSPKLDWSENEVPRPSDIALYLFDLSVLRAALNVMAKTPGVPLDAEKFTYTEANNIEKILEDINFLLNSSAQAWYYSEDVFSGEV